MILEYKKFADELNETLFNGSSSDLLNKIADNPDRYVGIFRPTKPKTKLIQNVTQSHEIRFGDALENVFKKYFEALGFEYLDRKIYSYETENGKDYDIDQIFSKGQKVYLIEQKVRDDHDSTKKVGQFDNFEVKCYEVSKKYSNYTLVPIMWFIDDALKKNKKYYTQQINKMNDLYGFNAKLYYGEEMFSNHPDGIAEFSAEMWEEIVDYLKRWREDLPDFPEVNFDADSEKNFEEIKDLKPVVYRHIFENSDVVEQVLPILFPTGEVLKKLKVYFESKNEKIYGNIAKYIEEYIDNNY